MPEFLNEMVPEKRKGLPAEFSNLAKNDKVPF